MSEPGKAEAELADARQFIRDVQPLLERCRDMFRDDLAETTPSLDLSTVQRRERFVMAAMQGFCATMAADDPAPRTWVPNLAIETADATIAALGKEAKPHLEPKG